MRARMLSGALIIAITAMAATVIPAAAQSGGCQGLWVERNSIYKANGYCFKTQRGIAYFGNAGCTYDSESQIPFSPRERARIDEIVRAERAMGCR